MAIFDDLFKGDIGRGLLIGVGVSLVAPVVLAVGSGVARPLARATVKTGIIAYEKGREAMAEIGEVFDDLVAEAKAEIERNQSSSHIGTVAAVGTTASEPAEKGGEQG